MNIVTQKEVLKAFATFTESGLPPRTTATPQKSPSAFQVLCKDLLRLQSH